MFKVSTFLFLVLFGIISCQPDPPPGNAAIPDYYLTAKFNGADRAFNSFPRASVERYPNGFGNCILSGEEYLPADTNRLSIAIHNYPPDSSILIKPGTYPIGNFYLYVAYQTTFKERFYTNYAPDRVRFSITLTEITSEHIKGIFNGTLSDPLNTADSVILTNGKFYLPVLR